MSAEYTSNLAAISRAVHEAAARGLTKAAEHVLTASRRVVPLDEATLERSGRTDVDTAGLRAAVSYDTVYAVRQHEEMTWRHDPGRGPKYLEGPLAAEAGTVQAIVAAEVRRALR